MERTRDPYWGFLRLPVDWSFFPVVEKLSAMSHWRYPTLDRIWLTVSLSPLQVVSDSLSVYHHSGSYLTHSQSITTLSRIWNTLSLSTLRVVSDSLSVYYNSGSYLTHSQPITATGRIWLTLCLSPFWVLSYSLSVYYNPKSNLTHSQPITTLGRIWLISQSTTTLGRI